MLVVYRLGTVHGRLQPYTFLLAGVVYNAFAGALIMALNAIADFYQAHGILFWLMGNLQTQSYRLVVAESPSTRPSALAGCSRHARSSTCSASATKARCSSACTSAGRGGVRRSASSSLLVGAVVSVSGMIGFVGLIVPHVMRLLIGADHRLLLPASVLVGAIFLVVGRYRGAHRASAWSRFPVGVVTALCGGPFFVYLLKREGGRALWLSRRSSCAT